MSNHWERITRPKCTGCPLHLDTNVVCSTTGKGPIQSSILFVTGPPDEEDEVRGRPMMGAKGRELTSQLIEAGWDLPYCTAPSVCCRPKDDRAPRLASEVRACRNRFLLRTIREVSPRLIVCWGLTALKAVTDDAKVNIKNSRRRVLYHDFEVRDKKNRGQRRTKGIPVVVTFDPGAVLRSPYLRQVVVEDIEWFQSVYSGGGKGVAPDKGNLVYVLQGRDEDLGSAFGNSKTVSIDIETTTFSPWDPDARLLCAAASDQPCHAAAFTLEVPHLREKFRRVLASRHYTKVFHNGIFDVTWLMKNGYKVRGPMFDTMVAFHLLNENYPDKTLAHLANLFLPGMEDYHKGMKGERGTFTSVDERLLEYCAADSDATRRLRDRFALQLRRRGLLHAFRLRMRVLPVLAGMQIAGLHVDQDRLRYHGKLNYKARRRIQRWFRDNVRLRINLESPQQVQRLLFTRLGLTPVVFSKKTKKPSANEKALHALKLRLENQGDTEGIGYQVLVKLLEYRTAAQLEKMYLKPIRNKHLRWDGRIHTTFKLTGTRTGRLASAGPNVQNFPPVLRDIVVSRFDGGSIIKADQSQMELRVLAHCTQDPFLLAAFKQGRDIHTATAAKLFGIPEHKVDERQRYLAKTTNFGIIYGMEAKRLASETGMTVPEAQSFLRLYWDQLPKVREWIHGIRDEVRKKGYVRSLFGVRRNLPIDDPDSYQGQEAMREAVNHVIQSTASDINLVAMLEVHHYIRKMKSLLVNVVHDDIMVDAHPDELDELMILMAEVCSRPPIHRYGVELSVPLSVDVTCGPSWGKQKETK